jgi:hypothetical protein
MPYKSEAQRKFFNSPEGKAKVGAKVVADFNKATGSKRLPDRAPDTFDKSQAKKILDVLKGV